MKKRQTLRAYGKSCLALAALLREEQSLDREDQSFIENHLVILHLAYSAWKSKQRQHTERLAA